MKMVLENLNTGDNVKGDLAVKSAVVKKAANGPYVEMVLTDGFLDIVGKRWKSNELVETNKVYDVIASVDSFNGTKNLNIKRMTEVDRDIMEFGKQGPTEEQGLLDNLEYTLQQIQDKNLWEFVVQLIDANHEAFVHAPAATSVHHDYHMGLLQHSLEVAVSAQMMTDVMIQVGGHEIDKDMVIAGALLHDIGKVAGYKMNGINPEMTDTGRFVEHLAYGTHMIYSFYEELERKGTVSITRETAERLSHCVASHHGNLEWGSPVKPNCMEALIIHYCDDCSAKCAIISEEKKKHIGVGKWTPKNNFFLGTRLYLGENNE